MTNVPMTRIARLMDVEETGGTTAASSPGGSRTGRALRGVGRALAALPEAIAAAQARRPTSPGALFARDAASSRQSASRSRETS